MTTTQTTPDVTGDYIFWTGHTSFASAWGEIVADDGHRLTVRLEGGKVHEFPRSSLTVADDDYVQGGSKLLTATSYINARVDAMVRAGFVSADKAQDMKLEAFVELSKTGTVTS
jgi:hypothetical protein